LSRGAFTKALRRRQTDPSGRRWIFVPYDQLSDAFGPLSREDPTELGIILVECPLKASRRPYHKQKLALVLANLRHFALEQAARGVAVRHVVSDGDYGSALEDLLAGAEAPVRAMLPAERELREEIRPLVDSRRIETLPHEGWLTSRDQFERACKTPPFRMDAFYRTVRRESGILMEGGKPVGGKFSFDAENRKPWPGEPAAAEPPEFPADPIKDEVLELVETAFADHPGELRTASLPATRDDAERLRDWAREHCLPLFGPYEDAMSVRSSNLFHTRLSSLMNLHRILPRRVVEDVATSELPLASKEGFIRQVLGWREFVRHVHETTDGFRRLPDGAPPEADTGAAPSALGASEPLPPVFWGASPSGLACLDHVVSDVWAEGYSHHITRLMVLSNIATLLDVSPRKLTDWFWVAYTDAYDWVVEPNVLGMGTFAVGELMTTKPYISGAAYIDRMSDYCGECAFDPRKTCPLTPMYWAFLDRHADALAGNPRMRLPLASLRRRGDRRRGTDREISDRARVTLENGGRLEPADLNAGG
jgi:deoxyribodipyrimidine photolyase-related protein